MPMGMELNRVFKRLRDLFSILASEALSPGTSRASCARAGAVSASFRLNSSDWNHCSSARS